MRFIYVVLIGLVVFNAMLMLFASSFNQRSGLDDVGVDTASTLDDYGDIANAMSFIGGLINWPLFIGMFTGFLAAGFLNRFAGGTYSTTLILGVGLFASIISSLWFKTFETINQITGQYGDMLNGIVAIITIAIGLLVVFTVTEFFTGQQGAN
jgi:hypothetical protein